jgi:hypothetical protein
MENDKDWYIEELEKVIVNKLLPIYDLYYDTMDLPKPELDIPIRQTKKQLPALLRADF